jgi:hypothetical protein
LKWADGAEWCQSGPRSCRCQQPESLLVLLAPLATPGLAVGAGCTTDMRAELLLLLRELAPLRIPASLSSDGVSDTTTLNCEAVVERGTGDYDPHGAQAVPRHLLITPRGLLAVEHSRRGVERV